MMLDTFRCSAKDLHHEALVGVPYWLRLPGDSDDPNTWNAVADVVDHFDGVEMFTVSFHGSADQKVFNASDQVEIAVIRPD
ncbi:hypothetical protein [Mycolicibacterium fortuitum]|uniref:hypothetical protein n=1 Tax=Mycolicibacterium fortuitum TaxID=1766 RepID=UPI003AACEE1C